MRKLLILILFLNFINLFVMADENSKYYKNAVYLDLSENNQEQNIQRGRVNMDAADIDYNDNSLRNRDDKLLYEDVNRLRPEKKSVSKSVEKKILKDTSVGAEYSATEKSGKMNDSVSVYSKYQKKHFGFTTAYSQDRDTYKSQGAGAGTVSLAPEISLNKHVKLKNVYSDNMASNQKKSEVVLSIRPFKDERMDLDLGAGETFSNGNQPAKSQINLGTKFRF